MWDTNLVMKNRLSPMKFSSEYVIEGKKLARITKICDFIDLKGGLPIWAAGLGFTAALNGEDSGYQAYQDVLDSTSNFGSSVHHVISDSIKKRQLELVGIPERIRPTIDQYAKFLMEHKFEPKLSEEIVYSLELGVAGTVDLVAEIDGVLTLLDFKTSSDFRLSSLVQLAGYDLLLRKSENGKKFEVSQYAILRLPRDGSNFEYLLLTNQLELAILREAFIECLALYKRQESIKEILKQAKKRIRYREVIKK